MPKQSVSMSPSSILSPTSSSTYTSDALYNALLGAPATELDEERRAELLDLLYGSGSTTLTSSQRNTYEQELQDLEDKIQDSQYPTASGTPSTPSTPSTPTTNTGVAVSGGGVGPTSYTANDGKTYTGEEATEMQRRDYNDNLLRELGLAYSAKQIDMATYSQQSQAIMAYDRAGEYYTGTISTGGGAGGSSGGYYTPYTSGASSSGTSGSSGSSSSSDQAYQDWYDDIMKARDDAMAKQEELYQQSKAAIDAMWQMGLMSETEYNNALTSARETLEAQYSNLKTQTTESLYGNVNKGALEGRLADIDLSRISSLAGSNRDLYAQMQAQNYQAARDKASGYSDLFSKYQIPYPEIPAPNMGQYGGTTSGGGSSSGITYQPDDYKYTDITTPSTEPNFDYPGITLPNPPPAEEDDRNYPLQPSQPGLYNEETGKTNPFWALPPPKV